MDANTMGPGGEPSRPPRPGAPPAGPVLVVAFDELSLKGANKGFFLNRLVQAIRISAPEHGSVAVRRRYGRLVVPLEEGAPPRALLLERLTRIPGLRYVLEGIETDDDLESILEAVRVQLPTEAAVRFGVRTRRVDKTYPIRSEDLSARVGTFVLECRPGWKVHLRQPDLPIRIDIVNRRALVTVRRHEGSGGLPVGVSGRGVLLISGGIDSPVAADLMLRRGLRLDLLHFHSAPFTGTASQEKVRDVARLLLPMQPSIDLLMVPFAEPIQQAIVQKTPSRYRVILYRRFMARLAVRAARETGASCLVTGESLGQVASQTIENLTTIEATSALPILRPLIGMGKSEIIDAARRLGSFEISLQPHDDCCSYLMPRHPMTRTTPEELDAVEEALDVDGLLAATWPKVTRETLHLGES